MNSTILMMFAFPMQPICSNNREINAHIFSAVSKLKFLIYNILFIALTPLLIINLGAN